MCICVGVCFCVCAWWWILFGLVGRMVRVRRDNSLCAADPKMLSRGMFRMPSRFR